MLNEYQLGLIRGLSFMANLVAFALFMYIVYTLITSLENQSDFLWLMFIIYVVMMFSSSILAQIKSDIENKKLKEYINKKKWNDKYGV